MNEPYYAVALAALRTGEDGALNIRLHAVIVHPDPGDDPEQLAIDAARRELLPDSEGWHGHYAVATPLDAAISATMEAERTARPNELRIVRYSIEEAE